MNYFCKIDGQLVKTTDIKDRQLKLKFEKAEEELLVKIPSLNSLQSKTVNIIAYIENDLMRFRVSFMGL